MEDSSVNVPRWSPTPSPRSTSPAGRMRIDSEANNYEDHSTDMASFVSEVDSEMSFSRNVDSNNNINARNIFPFTNGPLLPRLASLRVPSLKARAADAADTSINMQGSYLGMIGPMTGVAEREAMGHYDNEDLKRWTPSSSPTRALLKEQMRHQIEDEDYDDQEYSEMNSSGYVGARSKFPFSNSALPLRLASFEAPSLKAIVDPENKPDQIMERSSLQMMEQRPNLRPMQGAGDRETTGLHTAYGKKNIGGGIYVSWKDLWVTVPDMKDGGRRPILQGLTGYVEPGEALAIMGPSGCGKSTLLDTLAGRLDSNTRQTGEILLNGRKQTLAFGVSAYVTQDDTLMTTLTVREAVCYSAQLQLPDSMSRSEKIERAEETIRDMGLQDAMDTRIGGWSVKGLSGGQKRRVSICIEILTRPKLLFLDEPTSGLDSAASYHVMNRIIKLAQEDKRTVIASIHQPSSEVFELFHNLCLLSAGRTVYFGNTSAASEFFTLNGFPCPTMRNPSDHFLRTINKDFDSDIEQGLSEKTTAVQAINVLTKSYKAGYAFEQTQQRISELCSQQTGGMMESKGSQAGFTTQCLVLTRRSFVNMYRDLGYYWLRLAIYIALCLCVGTIFFDIGHSYGSIQARGSMLMFVAAFLTFMAIGGFPSFVEDMKIFTRERLNGHYGVAAFVFGNTFSSIPYLVMISLIPGAIAYYLVGLQKGIDHFAYFSLVLFITMMLVESLMMIVASIVPDFLMGIITGAGIQGVMMLNGGFFRLPDDLPKPFWRYPMYYIAFHKYANQGFYKNEFEGLTFPNELAGGPPTITGEEILKNTWQVETGYSKWIDVAILFGMVILYRLMFLAIIKATEKVKPMIRALMTPSPKQATHVEEFLSSPPDPHQGTM